MLESICEYVVPKADAVDDVLIRRISSAISETFCAAKRYLTFNTRTVCLIASLCYCLLLLLESGTFWSNTEAIVTDSENFALLGCTEGSGR